MTDLKTLYEEDTVAWAENQSAALRAAAKGSSNQPLDWENLAEEIADLGKAQRSALGSYVLRIVQHLTKLEHSPAVEPRNGWRRSIRLARAHAQRRLKANPSLRTEIDRIVEDELELGIEYAIADLEEYGEIDEVGATALRRTRYTAEQILGDWFPPEAEG